MRARLLALALALASGRVGTLPAQAREPGPVTPTQARDNAASSLSTSPVRLPSRRLATAKATRCLLAVHVNHPADLRATIAAAEQAGASTRHVLPEISMVSFSVPTSGATRLRDLLRARHGVQSIIPVGSRRTSYTPSDARFPSQQGYLSAINAPTAWDTTRGSASVRIAVIDTGIDVTHPDLASKVVDRYNAVAGAASTTDVTDLEGHGTFVAGVAAAATDNGSGVAGVGFDSSLVAVKVADADGYISTDDEAAGIIWAATRAKVINISLGSADSDAGEASAIRYAQQHGALVVAAAGNDGLDQKNYPAAYPGVLAVGATSTDHHEDSNSDGRADFSNFGRWISLAAPGVDVLSTLPPGGSFFGDEVGAGTSGYGTGDGTSFSSPMVAGAAALLLGAAPSATAAVVRKALVDTAHGYVGLGLGAGQIDVAAALTHVPPGTTPTFTAPGPAAVLTGVVTASVITSAPLVQLAVDGAAVGPPVAAADGSAQTSLETWGYTQGSHSLTARDCNAYGCSLGLATVQVMVDNPTPTITAPAASARVHDAVTVTVTTTDAVPLVQLLVDGVRVGAPVPVTDNAATLTWPSAGFANGTRSVAVADCASNGRCAASSAVDVELDNTAPTLDAPTADQTLTGPATLAASSTSGGVLFRLDGRVVGFVRAAPYTAPVDLSATTDGAHSFTAQACGATATQCQGPVSAARSFRSRSLHPRLLSQSYGTFSPNGDRRADATTASYALPDAERVTWTVRDASGATVRGPLSLGAQPGGRHAVSWNGYTNSGRRAGDAAYTLTVAVARQVGPALVLGDLVARVRVDTFAPVLTNLVVSTTSFYPYLDGFQDSLLTHITIAETGSVTMRIRDSHDTVVRTLTASGQPGTRALSWNGRSSRNALVPTGTYGYDFTSTDAALNTRTVARRTVALSTKRLVGRAVTTTVSPTRSKTDDFAGVCSEVRYGVTYVEGIDYESNLYCNGGDGIDSVVVTEHLLTLPAAVRYASISLSATGRRSANVRGSGQAYLAYVTPDEDLAGYVVLPAREATTGASVKGDPAFLYRGRNLRWLAGTDTGSFYSLQSFLVRYTYYVLV